MQQRSGLSGNRDRPGPGGLGIGAKLLIRKTKRGIVHEDTDCVFGEVSPAHLEDEGVLSCANSPSYRYYLLCFHY
jgi:hypothetical protein